MLTWDPKVDSIGECGATTLYRVRRTDSLVVSSVKRNQISCVANCGIPALLLRTRLRRQQGCVQMLYPECSSGGWGVWGGVVATNGEARWCMLSWCCELKCFFLGHEGILISTQ